jgi:hypothetical protein
MKTLADEIIERKHNDENDCTPLTKKQLSNFSSRNYKMKPKSAGNKSFRIHNNLKFMKTIERSQMGKENKL